MEERDYKNQRTGLIIVSVLLFLALVGIVILLIRNGNIRDEAEQAQTQVALTNTQLQERTAELQARDTTIQTLRTETAELETKLNEELEARSNRIARANRRADMNEQEADSLRIRTDTLEQEVQAWQESYEKVTRELETARGQIATLQQLEETVADSISEIRDLKAYNIYPLTKWNRWLWADRFNVDKAKRVDEIHVAMEVGGNVFSPLGERDVYLVIRDPQGEIVSPGDQEFINQETGSPMAYTAQSQIDFALEPVPVNFVIEEVEDLEPGVYQLEVYIDGRLARSSTMQLE